MTNITQQSTNLIKGHVKDIERIVAAAGERPLNAHERSAISNDAEVIQELINVRLMADPPKRSIESAIATLNAIISRVDRDGWTPLETQGAMSAAGSILFAMEE
jgi:hypothetical protein